MNLPPNVATPTVGANPVTTTNTTLSVQASDERPENTLTYSWSIVSAPSAGDAYFSLNDSNTAKNTTVTFFAGGNFTFQVTVTDAGGLSATSNVTLNVQQTPTGINVTPHDAAVLKGTTRQFAATAVDQFGNDLTNQPSFTWAVQGGVGSINSSGLYTAPSSGNDSSFTVSASYVGKTGSANVAFKKGNTDIINFDDLPLDTVLTDQYGWAVFSTAPGVTLKVRESYGTSAPHSIYTFGALTQPDPDGTGGQNVYVNFPTPVNGLQFNSSADDANGVGAQVRVFHSQGTSVVDIVGSATPYTGGELVDLSQFQNISRIEIFNVTDPGGLAYDDFSRRETLLELTVADHNNAANKATAIDAAIRELYVPEDETNHTAEVDIRTLFDPSDAANKIHLKVQRDDGWIVADDNVTTLDKILQVTEQARVFTITAWLDKNGNNQFDSGVDDQEQTKVYVNKAWTSQGTWTVGNAAIVKANADGASLQQLVLNITGNAADASA